MPSKNKGRLTSRDDHIIERWASACEAKNGCDFCPYQAECEETVDKLIGRVHLVTQSGVTASKTRGRPRVLATA